jgi:Mrp family chromosome partitioning ATPase
VLIDTAPLLASSDTLGLVARASGVVAVARLDHTRRDAVRRMTRLVRDAHGRLLGVVATGTRPDRVSAETSQPEGAPAIIGG